MTSRSDATDGATWLAVGVAMEGDTGGSLRAAHILRALVDRTSATVVRTFGRRGLPATSWAVARVSRAWTSPVNVASARLLPDIGLMLLRSRVRGRLLDLHDHPRLQLEALGVGNSPSRRAALDGLLTRNLERFEFLSVPSASFAELCSLPYERVIVATNGTDTRRIEAMPVRDEPIVAMVSGAAPGRGIEQLVEAMPLLRAELPSASLRLALGVTSPSSAAYLADLRRRIGAFPWVTVESVPYARLSAWLGAAQVLVIPHPAHPYLDAATPVKLFDGMAAGRPTVATPRFETAEILRRWDAGVVTGGDDPDYLAAAMTLVLSDGALRERLGANARRAAVEEFDWLQISARLADAVLALS